MVDDDRVRRLEGQVRELEARLARLEGRAPAAPAPDQVRDQGWIPVAPLPGGPAARPASPQGSPALRAEDPRAWPQGRAGPATAAPSRPVAPVRKPRDLETLLGANWLARAGILVLALGVVFFLKLAYDRGWVPLVGRYAIGVAGGLALLALGDLLRRAKKRRTHPAFTQILSGGGGVVTYVTVYLGWAFPEYRAALHLTLPVEVTLLALASGLLAAYAVWRNLPILAGVAVLQSAVLVAPAGAFSEVGLLYVALLDAALLAAALWRGWMTVVVAATLASGVAHLVALLNGVDWRLSAASAAVVMVLAQLAAQRTRASSEADPALRGTVGAVSTLGLAVILAAAFAAGHVPDAAGWASLAVACAALGGALALRRMAPSTGTAGAFLLLAWPTLHFGGDLRVVLAYAGLAAAALAVTRVFAPAARWTSAFAAAALGLGALFLVLQALMESVAQVQPWESAGLAVALFLLGATHWAIERGTARRGISYGGLGVALAVLAVWPFLQFPDTLWQPFVFAAAASAALAIASAWSPEARLLRMVAAGVGALAALALLVLHLRLDVAGTQPWPASALALWTFALGAAVWATSSRHPGETATPQAGIAVAAAMLLVWPFLQFPDDLWQTVTLATSGIVLGAAALLWAPGRVVAQRLALAATAAAVLSLAILAMARDAVALQPLLGGVAAALATASGALLWQTGRAAGDPVTRPAALAAAALAPVLYAGHLLEGWQVAVAWAAEGLALAALGMALRDVSLRVASFAVFGLVLGRIFLVDLQDLDMPFRVLTFLITGTVLLVAAYLFARQRKTTAAEPQADQASPGLGPR
jgi:uncharacterized membrane protein